MHYLICLPNTIQYNTIQYNTIQYNTIQYNTIQYKLYYKYKNNYLLLHLAPYDINCMINRIYS